MVKIGVLPPKLSLKQEMNYERGVKSKLRRFKNKFQTEDIANSEFVSDENFFYWSNIVNPINEHLWEDKNGIGGVNKIFQSEEEIHQIKIFEKIDNLRMIRNGIAHNKSIINNNLITQYQDCRKILGMMSKDALDWCDKNCRFLDVHPKYDIISAGALSSKVDIERWIQTKVVRDE